MRSDIGIATKAKWQGTGFSAKDRSRAKQKNIRTLASRTDPDRHQNAPPNVLRENPHKQHMRKSNSTDRRLSKLNLNVYSNKKRMINTERTPDYRKQNRPIRTAINIKSARNASEKNKFEELPADSRKMAHHSSRCFSTGRQ